jgi:ABC-type polysaccharide/polyol phosphate transport system ATPase subunit
MEIVRFKDVWEKYRIKFIHEGRVFWEDFWALKGVSFSLNKGEALAIMGENGAGKTTILKLIAGLLMPDRGEVKAEGKVSALLEPGLGFHPELTGKENVYLGASLFGLTKEKTDSLFGQIEDFAEIGKFMDSPLKYYSQGMFVRLAFSLTIHILPDILLIDEILAVGDIGFQKKCINKISELRENGLSLIFVTQDINLAKKLVKRGIFLKGGEIIIDDSIERASFFYLESIEKEEKGILEEEAKRQIGLGRLRLLGEEGGLRIFWEEKELTQAKGFYTAICSENKWYHSFDFPTKIEKQEKDSLLLSVDYPLLSLKEYLRIKILEENEIDLEIEMELDKEIIFLNRDIRLETSSLYQSWITSEEEGEFSQDYINEISPVRLKNSKVREIGLKGRSGLPDLTLKISEGQGRQISSLYKKKEKTERIVLQASEMIPKKNQIFYPGRSIFFKGKIILDRALERKKAITTNFHRIKNRDLEFVFEEGKGKVFWKNKELTLGLGMYTSFRSSGIWYDSSLAVWKVREKSSTEIEILGDWPYIPVSQIWRVLISDIQKISWKVETEIYDKANLELEQINLMFNPGYKSWVAENAFKGDFLDEFCEDYDILPFRFFYGPVNELKASGPHDPYFIFRSLGKDDSFQAVIGNTDSLYKARLFQYQRNLLTEELKGHFWGEIQLLK